MQTIAKQKKEKETMKEEFTKLQEQDQDQDHFSVIPPQVNQHDYLQSEPHEVQTEEERKRD